MNIRSLRLFLLILLFGVFTVQAAPCVCHAQQLDLNLDGAHDLALFYPFPPTGAQVGGTQLAGAQFSILDPLGAEQRAGCPGAGSIPVPGSYLPGGGAQLATWNPSFGFFQVCARSGSLIQPWGEPGDLPVPADFNGDGLTDYALYRRASQEWFVLINNGALGSAPVTTVAMADVPPGSIPAAADFDGDGKADLAAVFPESGALRWRIAHSTGGTQTFLLGALGDIPVPADFDGNGLSEPAVFRASNGNWYFAGGSVGVQFGLPGDVPSPLDFDGDNAADFAVYRPTQNRWFIRPSAQPGTVLQSTFGSGPGRPAAYGGAPSYARPALNDFNGDRLSDFAMIRKTSSGSLLFLFDSPGSGIPPRKNVELGNTGDLAFAGDFDGDGISDPAVIHSSSGFLDWIILESASQSPNRVELRARYGVNADLPIPADYDGDRRTDLSVIREIAGGFLLWLPFASGKNVLPPVSWGLKGDIPFAADVDGDGSSDYIVTRRVGGERQWFVRTTSGSESYGKAFGFPADTPIVADVDGDGRAELGVLRDVAGEQTMFFENGAVRSWGLRGDVVSLLSFSGSSALINSAWRLVNGQGFFFLKDPVIGPLLRPFGVTGDIPLPPSGVVSSAQNVGSGGKFLQCATRSAITSQESGFAWKPASDGDGKLAVIFGGVMRKRIKTVALVQPGISGDQVLETMRFVGNKAGVRPTFRATRAGAAYPKPLVLVRQDTLSQNHCIDVSDPARPIP